MRDMAETVGVSKPKHKMGAPPPFEKERPAESLAEEAKELPDPKMPMQMGKPEPQTPASATVQSVCEKYGADPKMAKAFFRELAEAMFGEEEPEGGDFPPAE